MKRARTETSSPQQLKTQRNSNDLGIFPVGSVSRPRSWAIYGRSGSGKTTFAATFPKPILILDIRDQGTDSIADEEDIDIKEIETFDDVEEVYYYLKEHPKRYKSVIFDTITQMQQLIMEEMLAGKRGKGSNNLGDWGTITRREWGDVAAKMKEWILNFRNLPIEVAFLAQERTSSVEEEENADRMLTPEVGPQVMPSVATTLNAAVSIIGNTFVGLRTLNKELKGGKKITKEEARYRLRVGPNPVYTTKLRKPKAIEPPAWIDSPTHAAVISIIKGED